MKIKVDPLYLYYGFLLLLLCSWMSPSLPSMKLRMAFFILVLAPLPFTRKSLFPCILSTFVIISTNRSVPSFMPITPEILLTGTLIMLLIGKKWKKKEDEQLSLPVKIRAPWLLWLLSLYTLGVNLMYSPSMMSISLIILIIIFFHGFYNSDNIDIRSTELSFSFVIITLVLCLEVLLFGGQFDFTPTIEGDELERVSLNDPNYFTCIIGMGVVASLGLLLYKELGKNQRLFLYFVILLAFVVSLKVASRGGIIAISGKTNKAAPKIMLLMFAVVIVLYGLGAFDVLFNRFSGDEGELGGRQITWAGKWADFMAQASPLNWLIGMGYEPGFALAGDLGKEGYMGFHNDYFAFFMCYGILGFLLFLMFLLYPIIKYKDPRVTAGMVFIILAGMTLEPLSSGSLDFYYFYFFLCILGESSLIEAEEEEEESDTVPEEPAAYV